METNISIKEINKLGYSIEKKLFSEKEIQKVLNNINNKKSKSLIPFSNTPWGYGNLINDLDFKVIYENKSIQKLCHDFLGKNFVFNHLLVNNKAPFIGPSVEWHREIFNVNTFAPGAIKTKDCWLNFLQIYIALDRHEEENGCLKVIPKSHLINTIPYEDIMNDRLGHKRRVPSTDMRNILKNHIIKSIYMEPGDVLFFNHKLLHGSSSNASSKNRKSIVLQARLPFERNEKIFNEEVKFRDNFILSVLQDKIKERKSKNVYKDFAQGQKK